MQGNIDLTQANIGQLFAYTSGAYNASNASMSLAAPSILYANAGTISTGTLSGGSQAIFVSNSNLNVSGNLNVPGGYLYLYGNTLSTSNSASLTAQQATFSSINNSPITIAPGDGSSATGYVVSENLLNNTHASLVQIGNGGSANITVQGNIDLTRANIGQLFAYTSGSYVASGSSTLLGNSMSWYVNAGTISTGSLHGGNLAQFVSSGLLSVDGVVESNVVIFDGHPVIYTPISYMQISKTLSVGSRFVSLPAGDVWLSSSSRIGLTKYSDLVLVKDDVIFNAKEHSRVIANGVLIRVSKGAIIRIVCKNDSVIVQNLHDNHKSSVVVSSYSESPVNVDVGKELIVFTSKPDTTFKKQSDKNGRRGTTTQRVGMLTATLSEFSLVCLSSEVPLLSALLDANGREEKATAERIKRTNACLGLVTAKRGAFVSHQ